MLICNDAQAESKVFPLGKRVRSILGYTDHACKTAFLTLRLHRIYIKNQGKLLAAADKFCYLQEGASRKMRKGSQ